MHAQMMVQGGTSRAAGTSGPAAKKLKAKAAQMMAPRRHIHIKGAHGTRTKAVIGEATVALQPGEGPRELKTTIWGTFGKSGHEKLGSLTLRESSCTGGAP
eukprot:jgi/Tetstr1/423993/TSEL_014604.t1